MPSLLPVAAVKVVAQYRPQWPDVDVDGSSAFASVASARWCWTTQIDLPRTPDPEPRPLRLFEPVFDYEQVLVVPRAHPLAKLRHVESAQLADEVLDHSSGGHRPGSDIHTQFLNPAGVTPRAHRHSDPLTPSWKWWPAGGRRAVALAGGRTHEGRGHRTGVRLGRNGVPKKIHLG
ncbi:MAG: hypothetical protein IPM70_18695 [Proteobacteria bacterium]|nr:hypothetical protein [Pseudomonadota bacterium]